MFLKNESDIFAFIYILLVINQSPLIGNELEK